MAELSKKQEKLLSQSYAQLKERPETDWIEELTLLIDRDKDIKPIDRVSNVRLENLASEWPTCACGNQCAALPRLSNGIPRDTISMRLGMSFYNRILSCDWELALEIIEKIEARSKVLLEHLLNQPDSKKP